MEDFDMSHIPKVVVINGNGIGQYCDVKRIPLKGETAVPRNLRYEQDSGKGVNCAIVIGRLGGDVAYIGKAGKDDGGELNVKWLRDAGVNTDHFWLDPDIKTSLGLILLAENGENMIINFDSPGSDITMDEALEHLDMLAGAEHLITGFEIPIDVALACARRGKELNMKTWLNPSPIERDAVLPELPFVDLMCVNETEACILLGVAETAMDDWENTARRLGEKYKVDTVIITLGSKGACAWSPGGSWSIPARAVKLVDETGAGDAFLSVVVQNFVWGRSLREAMDYANLYCGRLVELPGSIQSYLTLEEMDGVLRDAGTGGWA